MFNNNMPMKTNEIALLNQRIDKLKKGQEEIIDLLKNIQQALQNINNDNINYSNETTQRCRTCPRLSIAKKSTGGKAPSRQQARKSTSRSPKEHARKSTGGKLTRGKREQNTKSTGGEASATTIELP